MTFCLTTTIIKPEKNISIKYAVILLHGYGGDGKDISMLTLNWKRFLPNTIFLCPNGHEKCAINPTGYQWFDLTKDDPEYILEQSKKAEIKLKQFIKEIKNEYSLENSQICLSGFSQGCMISINLGLTNIENYNCIVGFSGKIIDQKDLTNKGGTMRLGSYACHIYKNTKASEIYPELEIQERHRHRYEFNNDYLKDFESHGMIASGINPDNNLVEIIELKNNP